jgi:group I intron endonuclease
MLYVVYRLLNKRNGKSYVGLTKQGAHVRWKQHVRNSRNDRKRSYVAAAIKKHGIDCWEVSVLECDMSREDAKLAEIRWIDRLNTFHTSGQGYNLTLGGDAIVEFTDEVRRKISEAAKNRRPVSEKTRQRMREAALNRLPRQSMSQETRQKIREARLGKKATEETRKRMREADRPSVRDETRTKLRQSMKGKNSRPVEQLTLDGEFVRRYSSITDAQTQTGIRYIGYACRKSPPVAGGFSWRYVESVIFRDDEQS